MYERSTDSRNSTKSKEIHAAAEASDSQSKGAYEQRCGGSPEASNHSMTLYRWWGKALQQGAQTFLSGKRPQKDSYIKELKEGIQKAKEPLACRTQELCY